MAINPDPTTFASAPDSLVGRESSKARILVTDDRVEMLRLIDRALGDLYECEFASNVEQARRKLALGSFELALCDVSVGGEAALVFAEEVLREHPGTAVILVTAEDDTEIARKAFGFGAYGYLVEPLRPGQLLIATMNALRRRQLEVAAQALSRNLEQRFQTIIDKAPIPIYAKDASHRYVVANAKADELTGLGRGELVGKTDEAIMSPAGAVENASGVDNGILRDGSSYEAEETLHIGGVERTYKTVKFPLVDELQEIAAVCGRAIELNDSSTGDHVNRIGAVAAFLAGRLRLDPARVELLHAAVPMHDVGKIGIRDEILRKPGPLTAAERAEMQHHTLIGHELFSESKSELLRIAATIALTHHERFDGGGYPQGLAGEEIPLEGRITAVADVFDALLSDRCYRPAMSVDQTVALIREGRGSQFDPRIVDVLLGDLDAALSLRD